MRKYRIIIMTVVAAMAASLFSACSADEPEMTPEKINEENPLQPDADYNSRSFAELVSTTSDITLSLSDVKSYQKDDLTNGGWEEYDYTGYIGGGVPAPSLIVVKDGKVYTEMKRWSSANGPTYFSTALGLLMKTGAVKRGCEIYISRDFSLDEGTITACGVSLNVKNIKGEKMWLTTLENYDGGRTGNGGQHLYVVTYNVDENKNNCYHFDSVEDAYAWLIEKFRARFGEEVNLNDYTDGMAILTYPMFTVGMIEYELQQYLAGDLPIFL